jgi:integrase
MPKIKGDVTNSRPRTILTDTEFETLLRVTKAGPDRRNLSGEQRCQLFALAAMTGLRAQELNSLKPTSFHLDAEPAFIEIHCTISKRRKTDHILLRRDFAELLRPWLTKQDPDRRLWSCSESWWYKASSMLRADLAAAGIAHERDGAQIDFHSLRCFCVTRAILTGASTRAVMAHVRLSSESLLARYTKLPPAAIEAVVNSVPLPKLPA